MMKMPKFVIIGFQSNRENNLLKVTSQFDNIKLRDISMLLNNQRYPSKDLNLDWNKNEYQKLYYLLKNFKKSYYNDDSLLTKVTQADFSNKCPIVALDCSIQNEEITTSNSSMTLDIRLSEALDTDTRLYYLLIYNRTFNTTFGGARMTELSI